MFCMFVYVIPTTFGTATALLLRWRETLSMAAAPIAVALVTVLWLTGNSNGQAVAPAHATARSWSVLRIGMNAYTSGDSASDQIVCPTLAAEIALDSKQPPKCLTVRRAIPAANAAGRGFKTRRRVAWPSASTIWNIHTRSARISTLNEKSPTISRRALRLCFPRPSTTLRYARDDTSERRCLTF